MAEYLSDELARWQDVRELVRVSADVDPAHEIAAITDRLRRADQGGPALLFDRVRGHSMPVVTNMLGNPRRIAAAFGVSSLEDLARCIEDWLAISLPRGMLDTWKLLPRLAELAKWPPTVVKSGLCQQVVKLGRDVNLAELPVLTMWPHDAAATITWGQLHVSAPKDAEQAAETGVRRHVCVVPLQVAGRDRLLIHANEQMELWSLLSEYRVRAQHMPVAIVLGGDPRMAIASWCPLPARTDGLVFAGFLRNQSVEVVAGRSIPLEIPASAEIVIEGFVDPQSDCELAEPIGRETGFMGPPESLPVMRVTAITHRANPVFPALVPGPAPAESHWLDRACERLLLPIVKLWIPELVDWRFPFSGSCRHIVFASIRKTFSQQARKVMHALWSLPRAATAKMLIVVDADIDVADENAVWSCVAAHSDPSRDLVLWDGPADRLDHTTAIRGTGRKFGIDATAKRLDELGAAAIAQPLQWTPEIEEQLRARWAEYGLESWLRSR